MGPIQIIKKKRIRRSGRREDANKFYFFYFYFFFFSHFSLRYTEIGPSEFVGAISKVFYSMRATHGYQNIGVLSNSIRYGFSPK